MKANKIKDKPASTARGDSDRFVRTIYSIRDLRVGKFGIPCIGEDDATMIRQFGDLVLSGDKSLIAMHPEDFALYEIGCMDMETGDIWQSPYQPKSLVSGVDFAKKENK